MHFYFFSAMNHDSWSSRGLQKTWQKESHVEVYLHGPINHINGVLELQCFMVYFLRLQIPRHMLKLENEFIVFEFPRWPSDTRLYTPQVHACEITKPFYSWASRGELPLSSSRLSVSLCFCENKWYIFSAKRYHYGPC